MRKLLSNNGSEIVKAVLINIALEKRNAQLLGGADGQGLDLLIEAALNQKDQLLLKIVRNIAIHNGPTQAMFSVCPSSLSWLYRYFSPCFPGNPNTFISCCLLFS